MATNPAPKKPAAPAAAEESTDIVTQPAPASRPAVIPATPVGPTVGPVTAPVTVTLSHHHEIDGTAYAPGAEVLVAPEYAARLRAQGYAQH
ncbi:DUF7210 family protein [Streptomyces zaomyceticus]|uniref:DUF7210 family protein n=1 Tax=Streptomyces zaomyceticus TaxID=68286 RepID=UPI002E1DAC5E